MAEAASPEFYGCQKWDQNRKKLTPSELASDSDLGLAEPVALDEPRPSASLTQGHCAWAKRLIGALSQPVPRRSGACTDRCPCRVQPLRTVRAGHEASDDGDI